VGSQHHAPVALSPGKTRYPLYRRLGGPQGWSGRVRKISPPPGFFFISKFVHRSPDRPARSQSLYRLSYPAHNFNSVRYSDSSVGIATDYVLRSGDRIPAGVHFSAHVQTDPGTHPASCTLGTGSFPGVKRPVRGAVHSPPSSVEVKKD
jgi:hypothetical protein